MMDEGNTGLLVQQNIVKSIYTVNNSICFFFR